MSTSQFSVDSFRSKIATTQQQQSNSAIAQTTAQIRTATIADQKYIIASLVLAFSNDPVARWMYPDPYQYLTHFPRFVQTFGGKAFELGTAYARDGYSGAALWFPPGVDPDIELTIEILQESIFESDRMDVFAVLEQMSHYHPKEPHWYLPIIGVEPTQQGKSYGSALMQHHVPEQCDHDRIPAYLEASKPANVPFYERHGFEVLSTMQVGASPPIFPMVRYPQ
jgi:ribosomal protein S18 acetylase RimI-like enzyme